MRLTAIAVTCAALYAAQPATAASFSVLPTRLHIGDGQATAVLEVRNGDDGELTVQLDAQLWSQDAAGADQYADTDDIVFFPRIATLAAGETQVVRIAYRGPSDRRRERTYRLFVEELPVRNSGNQVAVQVALRLGVPIFIEPPSPTGSWELAAARVRDGGAHVTVTNTGNRHVLVSRIQTTGIDRAGTRRFTTGTDGWYVLAGQQRVFVVPLEEAGCRAAQTLVVQAEAANVESTLELSVPLTSPASCAPPRT